MEKIKKAVNEIEMPIGMKNRIINNCYLEMEEKDMTKNTKKFYKRPMVAAASIVLCLCLTGVTALAATGKLEGFFKDITDWTGAVIGTSYEQATEEINLNIVEVSDKLAVEIVFVNPEQSPYSFFETFGIKEFKIVDMNGNVIKEGKETDMVEVVYEKLEIMIPLENVISGDYKLVVSKMVGGSKADQPLEISGLWECEFGKE